MYDWTIGKHFFKGTLTYTDGTTKAGYFVGDEDLEYWGTEAEWNAKVEEWDAKIAKEKAEKEREKAEKELERLAEIAKKNIYDKIYSACLVDKSADVDMQVEVVRNAVMKECRATAENPSWYDKLKYN